MSGIIGSKLNIRGSERIAKLGTDGQVLTSSGAGVAAAFEDIAAGISWQAIETGSTMTAVAGNGYWIDTTSNACTITLPSSASVGDTIVFADYDRTWGTYGIELDSNGLNYQGQDDGYTVEYGTDGTALRIVYMDATKGWIPTLDKAVSDVPITGNSEGIFAFGNPVAAGTTNISNLVSSVGVVSTDVTGVGTARGLGAACEYGGDKGIFGFGDLVSMTNLVSNAGVVATDTTGVGTARYGLGGAGYGTDKGIMAFGYIGSATYVTSRSLVSNVGVMASDAAGAGTARNYMAACEYGTDTAIFGFGYVATNVSNLVSNTGVVASDTTGVGTARYGLGACTYATDKGIFAYGYTGSWYPVGMSNLVSNTGVVATDVAVVGTARGALAATQYGINKGIFGYGETGSKTAVTNLVSTTGVIASDTAGVGSARESLMACSFN